MTERAWKGILDGRPIPIDARKGDDVAVAEGLARNEGETLRWWALAPGTGDTGLPRYDGVRVPGCVGV